MVESSSKGAENQFSIRGRPKAWNRKEQEIIYLVWTSFREPRSTVQLGDAMILSAKFFFSDPIFWNRHCVGKNHFTEHTDNFLQWRKLLRWPPFPAFHRPIEASLSHKVFNGCQ